MDYKKLVNKYNIFYNENKFNIKPTVWTQETINKFNKHFRGENSYVWQEKLGDDEKTYIEYYKIIKSIDKYNLFDRTFENGSYGCIHYNIDNLKISRDLVDSITEIYFLKSFFPNLEELSLLEIGGGYGRLCKRYVDCFQDSKYYITDAIPLSTFVSKIYLNEKKNNVIDLYDIQEKLKLLKIDIVINIHSFPECNITDIEWWIQLIDSNKIKWIFYVPNDKNTTSEFMPSNTGECMLSSFNKYNYKVKHFQNMYAELNIKYSYAVPFIILENDKY